MGIQVSQDRLLRLPSVLDRGPPPTGAAAGNRSSDLLAPLFITAKSVVYPAMRAPAPWLARDRWMPILEAPEALDLPAHLGPNPLESPKAVHCLRVASIVHHPELRSDLLEGLEHLQSVSQGDLVPFSGFLDPIA